MFSQLYLLTLGRAVKICAYLGAIPFNWDKENSELRVVKGQRTKFQVVVAIVYFYTGFFSLRALMFYYRGDLKQFLLLLPYLFCLTLLCVIQRVFQGNPHGVPIIGNAFQTLTKRYQRKWMPTFNAEASRLNYYFDRYTIGYTYWILTSGILISISILVNPHSRKTFGNLYPPEFRNPWLTTLDQLLFVYMMEICFISMTLNLNLFHMYLFMVIPILESDLRPAKSSYRTLNELRSSRSLPTTYRSVQLMHKIFWEMYGPLILPLQGLVTGQVVICACILIRPKGGLALQVAAIMWTIIILSLIIWTGILWLGGKVNKLSEAAIQSWKYFPWTPKESKYIGKFKRSCRPLKIGWEGFYCIQRKSVLMFLQGCIRSTLRGLLALK